MLTLRRFGAGLLGALVLIVGALAPVPAYADGDPSAGADYSWYRPSAGELAGTRLVVRYLVPADWGSGKALTATEARWLLSLGKSVVLNYEWQADGALGGYAAGVRDAQRAEQARAEVGAPAWLPIYLSCDWDVQPWQVSTVLDYLRGAASVLGHDRVGVYGAYRIVSAALDAGYRWAWQTYAWSGTPTRWDDRAQLRQVANGYLWNGEGDLDRIIADPGAWVTGGLIPGPGDSVRPAPVPPPPPPAPVWYVVVSGDTLSGIGRRFGVSWQTLARINGLANPNLIYPGQRLSLGGDQGAAPGSYVVVSGDTLSGIGARFGVSWQTLARINGLANPNLIYPGERLRMR